MPYVSATELENALGPDAYLALADRDRDGSADTAAVDQALEDASALADSYLARYLPIATAPAALRRAVIALAIYDLAGNHATEDQRRRNDAALRWLRDIAHGSAALSLPEAEVEDGLDVHVDSRDPHFAFDERGWV